MHCTKVAKFEGLIGFKHAYSIGKYLGFHLLSGRVTCVDFSFIIDKVHSRLAGWKGRLISRAGRVTLAKSVLSSMPIYTMHNLWMPESICDKLYSCIKQFVWGGKSCHWVKWDCTSQPLSCEGLGLRPARQVNISMLGKHVWEPFHDLGKLWVRLLSNKYLQDTHILQVEVPSGCSYTWKSILMAANVLKPGYIVLVGQGDISLWY